MQISQGSTNPLSGCLGSIIVIIVFLFGGAGLTYWGWTIIQDAQASTSWPTTTAVITRNEIDFSTDSDGADSYQPEITYQYEVNGMGYAGNLIKFGENSYSTRHQAEEIAAPYPLGSNVTVHYDPADPAKAVLEPGLNPGSYIILSVGLCFMAVSTIPMFIVPLRLILRRRG